MRFSKTTQRISIFVLCFLWVSIMAVVGTVAYLFTATPSVVNTFTVPSDGSSIKEKIEGNVKKEVVIANTGDVDSFIRAKVIFTWQNEDGQVHPTAVATGDYQITWNTVDEAGKWSVVNGTYYYNGVVEAAAQTQPLFTECTPAKAAPEEGYTLHVEILSQSIQSDPATAVQSAWGMTYSNGAWSTYTTDGTN